MAAVIAQAQLVHPVGCLSAYFVDWLLFWSRQVDAKTPVQRPSTYGVTARLDEDARCASSRVIIRIGDLKRLEARRVYDTRMCVFTKPFRWEYDIEESREIVVPGGACRSQWGNLSRLW